MKRRAGEQKNKNQKAERERESKKEREVTKRGKRKKELLKEGFFLLLICFELINFLVSFPFLSSSFPLSLSLSHRLLMRIKRERERERCERNEKEESERKPSCLFQMLSYGNQADRFFSSN